jgi:competence ComEA-like helix-hairpin-helix protein
MDTAMKPVWIVLPLLILAVVVILHPPAGPAVASGPRVAAVSFSTPADGGAPSHHRRIRRSRGVCEAPGAARIKHVRGKRLKRMKGPASPIDLNRADAVQLQQIPGIGATLAARIVDVRRHDGPFTTYDQLLDVAGMTEARLDRVEPYLRL